MFFTMCVSNQMKKITGSAKQIDMDGMNIDKVSKMKVKKITELKLGN